MAASCLPTVVLVPGAYHPASCLDTFLPVLQVAGFPTVAHTLNSFNNASATLEDDEAGIRAVLTELLEEDKEVVVVVHSFAGMSGCNAVAELDKASRVARKEKGSVLGVVFMAAFVPGQEGDTLTTLRTGPPDDWVVIDAEHGFTYAKDHYHTFYNDCDPALAAKVSATLKGTSLQAVAAPPSGLGYKAKGFDGRRAYIHTQLDNCIPVANQERMVAVSGVDFITKSMDTSHSPYLSRPEELAKGLGELVKEFRAAK